VSAEEIVARLHQQHADFTIGPLDIVEARRLTEQLHTKYGILAGLKPIGTSGVE